MQNFTYHTHNNELHFDGHHSAEEMIAAAEAKGFAEIGVSNHLICHKNIQRFSILSDKVNLSWSPPHLEPPIMCSHVSSMISTTLL